MPDLSNAQRPKYFIEADRIFTADMMPSQPNLPLAARSSKTEMGNCFFITVTDTHTD